MTQSGDVPLLADKAQEALWHALRTGRLRDGQFLSMSQLVDILDCPIAAIREAVKHASSHGLPTTLPKRGVQVMQRVLKPSGKASIFEWFWIRKVRDGAFPAAP